MRGAAIHIANFNAFEISIVHIGRKVVRHNVRVQWRIGEGIGRIAKRE